MEKLKKIIISPTLTIKQALKSMDVVGEKILFVTDSQRRLLGTVTDGDIRRWILKKRDMNSPIAKAMNRNPACLKEKAPLDVAKNLMLVKRIDCIPVITADKKIVSAIWWMDLFKTRFKRHKKINLPVVIMAGGEGTRLTPFTKILPKPLIPVGEKPIVEIIVDRFLAYGCHDFYVSVNYKASILKAYFSDFASDCKIKFVQEEKPLGTVGSLWLFRELLKTCFFVTNCDILIEADYSDILKFHRKNRNWVTIVVSMKHYTIPYGVCEIQNGGNLKGIFEKPEYDFLVNTGMYIMEPRVLDDIPKNTYYNMDNLINDYVNHNKKIGVYPVSEKSWLDMGEFQELQKMLKKFEVKP